MHWAGHMRMKGWTHASTMHDEWCFILGLKRGIAPIGIATIRPLPPLLLAPPPPRSTSSSSLSLSPRSSLLAPRSSRFSLLSLLSLLSPCSSLPSLSLLRSFLSPLRPHSSCTRACTCAQASAHTPHVHMPKQRASESGRASSNVGRPNGVGTLDRDARGGFDT